jgi:multiple sugar transport system substrate-binding protein
MKSKSLIKFAIFATIVLIVLGGIPIYSFAQEEKPFEGVKLTAINWGLPQITYIKDHISEFEKMTGAKVDLKIYSELEVRSKVILDLATKAGEYEVVEVDNMYVPELVENGWLVPLDPYINPAYHLEDVFESYIATNSWEGKLYVLPIYAESTNLFYRKDWFEKERIKLPETMKEIEKVAKHFTEPKRNRYGIALRGLRGEGMNVYIWTGFLRAFGGEYLDENFEPIFNSTKGIQATTFYKKLLKEYAPLGASSFSWDHVGNALAFGNVAMIIDATDMYNVLLDLNPGGMDKIGYAMVPAGPHGRYPAVFSSGWGISKWTNEKERKAAAEFIQWATSKEMQIGMTKETGILSPTFTSVINSPPYLEQYAKMSKPHWGTILLESAEIALPDYRPRIPEWRIMGDIIGIWLEKIFHDEVNVQEGLNEAAKEVRELMIKTGRIKK